MESYGDLVARLEGQLPDLDIRVKALLRILREGGTNRWPDPHEKELALRWLAASAKVLLVLLEQLDLLSGVLAEREEFPPES
jgi:hypothetical protein